MLEDLYENNRYEVLKRTAEDRSAWRESIGVCSIVRRFDSPKVRQSGGLLYRLGSGSGLGPVLVLVESSDYRTFGLSIQTKVLHDLSE